MRIAVGIATVGRAGLTRQTVDMLADQHRSADMIVVAGASEADIAGVDSARGAPLAMVAKRGLCRQRNAILTQVRNKADIVVFFDDDFVPAPEYLAMVEQLFVEQPDVVGITGDLIGDGIHGGGFTIAEAQAMIAGGAARRDATIRPRQALYGCNMAIRVAAAEGLSFDEALPLYGWLEDIDLTYQLGRRGHLISTGLVTGVHLGTKGGRTSGRRVGYSQVANPVYLWRKGTMQPGLGERLLRQNLLSNLVRSIRPEPHIDRRGRLVGNLMAIRDWMTGRIDPRNIESI